MYVIPVIILTIYLNYKNILHIELYKFSQGIYTCLYIFDFERNAYLLFCITESNWLRGRPVA